MEQYWLDPQARLLPLLATDYNGKAFSILAFSILLFHCFEGRYKTGKGRQVYLLLVRETLMQQFKLPGNA